MPFNGEPEWRIALVTCHGTQTTYPRSYADTSAKLAGLTKLIALAEATRKEISIPYKESPLRSLRGVPGHCSIMSERQACETHGPGGCHFGRYSQEVSPQDIHNERQCPLKLARCACKDRQYRLALYPRALSASKHRAKMARSQATMHSGLGAAQ